MTQQTGAVSTASRRRRAVELRLAGLSLAAVCAQTGLSAPTIIGACRAFRHGGWGVLVDPARGRPVGSRRVLSLPEEAELQNRILRQKPPDGDRGPVLWTSESVASIVRESLGVRSVGRALSRVIERAGLTLPTLAERAALEPQIAEWRRATVAPLLHDTRRAVGEFLWCGELTLRGSGGVTRALVAQTLRGKLGWMPLDSPFHINGWLDFLERATNTWGAVRGVLLHGIPVERPEIRSWQTRHPSIVLQSAPAAPGRAVAATAPASVSRDAPSSASLQRNSPNMPLTHLQRLEAESIHIMREVIAEAERPVMLYTAGKDSANMLHIARKAFFPAVPPFPLLHIDTTWEFRDMYLMREQVARDYGMTLLVHRNPEALRLGINPFTHGSQIHADLWNTEGLRQALDEHRFDVAFGGARRDEEKSRAKERVFSFRNAQHRWDPKNQRPELWNLYNARKSPGESIRVFPLSNWTELDIWQYIYRENVPIVPLYLARERPVVERNGTLLMVDDERMPLNPGEVPVMRKVRFRTLGCYPLSGAIESEASTLPEVIDEMLRSRQSERQGRLIDHDGPASMERKKQEGYF